MPIRLLVFFLFSILALGAKAEYVFDEGLWDAGFTVPEGGRNNPYKLDSVSHPKFINAGKLHAQSYPVTVTGVLPPYTPIKNVLDAPPSDPLRKMIQDIIKGVGSFKNFNQALGYIGMHPYPLATDTGIYSVPFPNGVRPDHPMGLGFIERNGATGFTISCAECHSSRLFGKTVLGLTNRFPRANHTFVQAKKVIKHIDSNLFKFYTESTEAERQLFLETKNNLRSVGVKDPIALGLDTSLAQVALSLSHRNQDAYATKSEKYEDDPRDNFLKKFPADSKPAVWWNLKYKNRWLSDGSIMSGNPIFTNILWNEVGRGTDLIQLEKWLETNSHIIQELTTAVFSMEPPRITDFFPAEILQLEKAKQGEKLFNQSCSKCHGVYEKAWSKTGSEQLPLTEQFKTTKVKYPQTTFVVDVGTDPNRYLGMKALEPLNDLQISKTNKTIIKPQKGYVPPPLVGIWSRWPYFHNNSVPHLCAVLTRAKDRPKKYYSGNANDPQTDFDLSCNGYPLADKAPKAWKKSEHLFDTSKPGMKNIGHDEGIFLKEGQEIFTPDQKASIIQFMQTL